MHGYGMAQVCLELKNRGIDLSSLTAIELFSGTGAWATQVLYSNVKTLHAWEQDYEKAKLLAENCPKATICCGDSIAELNRHTDRRYDLVSMDNPMGEFGPVDNDRRYCEHFESILLVNKLLQSHGGIVIFDINVDPYDIELHKKWRMRREVFYGDFVEQGNENRSRLYANILQFYHSIFERRGYQVLERFVVARDHAINRYKDWLRFACFVLGSSK